MHTNNIDNCTAVRRIRAFAQSGTMPHALILSGSGERAEAARYAAAAMLCSAPENQPCLQCNQCRKALEQIHPDILTICDDDHKELPVDTVRDFRSSIYIRPNEGKCKVAIFPRAEQLNERDQNVLLKIVEEGPSYAAFIFCVENSACLLPTVRSRCVELKLQQTEAADVPDPALLRAFASGKGIVLSEYLTGLESRRMTREQLQTTLRAAWRTSAEALLLQGGKAAADPALAESTALLCRMDRRQLMHLTDLLRRYAQECEYNVGVGHVLGAIAAEWENIK